MCKTATHFRQIPLLCIANNMNPRKTLSHCDWIGRITQQSIWLNCWSRKKLSLARGKLHEPHSVKIRLQIIVRWWSVIRLTWNVPTPQSSPYAIFYKECILFTQQNQNTHGAKTGKQHICFRISKAYFLSLQSMLPLQTVGASCWKGFDTPCLFVGTQLSCVAIAVCASKGENACAYCQQHHNSRVQLYLLQATFTNKECFPVVHCCTDDEKWAPEVCARIFGN